ncbi:protein LURP-one-related 17-like [Durio zibethinus]|uniref:Protein LURP-one-related 17-like n=1 Tax=Durio zibethinus TaxID=66656 RepID=A0A6P5Y732_DURZI|nr:protein LURP-one-related 17-like [Durio zibethinus]
MFLFLKSLSRSVHDEEHQEQPESSKTQGDDLCTSLTVWRKSLILSCNGFTVIDSDGKLVYRVDNYIGRPKELILMDGSGKSILTMRRSKNLRLVDTWLVYGGEVGEFCTPAKSSEKPIFYVKKSINILHANPNVLAYVYRPSSDKRYAYMIEGSYSHRSCKVLDETKRVVAEIRRKDAIMEGISFGLDVFLLIVQAGFDPGFVMALVLLLDQMFS